MLEELHYKDVTPTTIDEGYVGQRGAFNVDLPIYALPICNIRLDCSAFNWTVLRPYRKCGVLVIVFPIHYVYDTNHYLN